MRNESNCLPGIPRLVPAPYAHTPCTQPLWRTKCLPFRFLFQPSKTGVYDIFILTIESQIPALAIHIPIRFHDKHLQLQVCPTCPIFPRISPRRPRNVISRIQNIPRES